MAVSDPCIISVAITGSVTQPHQTPHLPITPEQIAGSAIESWQAGAAIAHIHVRDPDTGLPTHNLDYYEQIRERVWSETDMVLNFTTGGFPGMDHDMRLETLRLRPEMGSYDAGSMNFGPGVFLNPPDFLRKMADGFQEYGVRPELECFDVGMIGNCLRLVDEGLIDRPLWWQFVLGVPGGAPATPKILMTMVEMLPEGSQWSVIGIGRNQLAMNAMGILLGGHVRTGLEDNIYYRRGELAVSNAQLVERLARLTRELGRDVATPDQARRLLQLRGME
jgi:3-keto-5-aminohexanoate cleavage enzyme